MPGSIDASRAEYYAFALNKLREQDTRVGNSLALHFISTLNTNCSVVDIGAGPVILIDTLLTSGVNAKGRDERRVEGC